MSDIEHPEKMVSKAWSAATLQEGVDALRQAQGVKLEPEDDDEITKLQAQLEDKSARESACSWSLGFCVNSYH